MVKAATTHTTARAMMAWMTWRAAWRTPLVCWTEWMTLAVTNAVTRTALLKRGKGEAWFSVV
eukprot:6213709-Pleurochrysis_carterae.AAC.3